MTTNDTTPAPLPHAPEAEAAVLACLIESPSRFAPMAWESQIGADYFHDPAHRALWELLTTRLANGLPVDPVSVSEEIRDKRPAPLSSTRLHGILLTEFSPPAWPGYVETLRDRHARRLVIQAGRASEDENETGEQAVARIRKAAESATLALSGASAVLDAKTSVKAFLASLTSRYENGEIPGAATGIAELDAYTGGLRPGELWVIGAPTSSGKSVFMLQVAGELIKASKRVAIFSLEMGADEVVARMISCHWRISMFELMNPQKTTKGAIPKIQRAASELEASELFICDRADQSMEFIAGHCQRLADIKPLDLVVIDYLQLVSAPRIKGQNREQEVAGISRACKQLAKRMKCPVITATQLNEQGKSRESRAIEQDADCVLFFSAATDEQTACLWKCRNGKRGVAMKVSLNGEMQKFTFS